MIAVSSWAWGFAAAAALLWPARIAGPLDGVPLDGVAEAILIGVVFPALLWFHPRFLRTSVARGAILALLAWKTFAAVAVVPDGWCVRFEPGRPYVSDATSPVPHSWDVRADWLSPQPACSAVMQRSVHGYRRISCLVLQPARSQRHVSGRRRPPADRAHRDDRDRLSRRRARRRSAVRIRRRHARDDGVFIDGEPFRNGARVEPGIHRRTGGFDARRRRMALHPALERRRSLVVESSRDAQATHSTRWRGAAVWRVVRHHHCVGMADRLAGLVRRANRFAADYLRWVLAISTLLGALVWTEYLDAARWGVTALAVAARVADTDTPAQSLRRVRPDWHPVAHVDRRLGGRRHRPLLVLRRRPRCVDVSAQRVPDCVAGVLARGRLRHVLVSTSVSMDRGRPSPGFR